LILRMGLFLLLTAIGSTRNYGLRYLLPMAPLAIVWVSGLAADELGTAMLPARWPAWLIGIGLVGQAVSIALSMVWIVKSVAPAVRMKSQSTRFPKFSVSRISSKLGMDIR